MRPPSFLQLQPIKWITFCHHEWKTNNRSSLHPSSYLRISDQSWSRLISDLCCFHYYHRPWSWDKKHQSIKAALFRFCVCSLRGGFDSAFPYRKPDVRRMQIWSSQSCNCQLNLQGGEQRELRGGGVFVCGRESSPSWSHWSPPPCGGSLLCGILIPPLYNLPSLYPTILLSFSLLVLLALLLSVDKWYCANPLQCPTVQWKRGIPSF